TTAELGNGQVDPWNPATCGPSGSRPPGRDGANGWPPPPEGPLIATRVFTQRCRDPARRRPRHQCLEQRLLVRVLGGRLLRCHCTPTSQPPSRSPSSRPSTKPSSLQADATSPSPSRSTP